MMGKSGKFLGERSTGILARGDRGQLDVRMPEQQAHHLLARVAGRAHNSDFLHRNDGVLEPWSVGMLGTDLARITPSRQYSITPFLLSACCTGSVCVPPAGRISCALSSGNRA